MTEVLRERRGEALWLTINRAERRNALNGAVLHGLREGVTAASEPGVRAVVITGAGDKAFCAGADLKPDAQDPFRSVQNHGGTGEDEQVVADPCQVADSEPVQIQEVQRVHVG